MGKKVLLVAACAATLSVTSPVAMAAPTSPPGNQGCQLERAPGQEFKNPGKMFQEIRQDQVPDETPKDVVTAFPQYFENVGALISSKCR